ncbi:MAG: hypothetical protein QXX41_02275 [Nitrososphaerota archaeon]
MWPSPIFHPSEADSYISKYLFPRLYEDIQNLLSKGWSNNNIAKLFLNPSRIARLTYLYHALPVSNLSPEKALFLAEFLLKLISFYRKDVFVESGKNLIWRKKQVETFRKNYGIITRKNRKDYEELKNLVSELNVLVNTYLELLYFCHQHIGLEVHGPYDLQRGFKLLVRDAYDIRPQYWEFCADLKYKRILIFTIYKNLEISLDYAGRIFSKGQMRDKLMGFQLLLEPESDLDIKEKINVLISNLQEVIKNAISIVNQLNKKELMKKYGEMFFYSIKPLRDIEGKDWRPPEGFYVDIENENLKEYTQKEREKFRSLSTLSPSERGKRLKKIWNIKLQYERML